MFNLPVEVVTGGGAVGGAVVVAVACAVGVVAAGVVPGGADVAVELADGFGVRGGVRLSVLATSLGGTGAEAESTRAALCALAGTVEAVGSTPIDGSGASDALETSGAAGCDASGRPRNTKASATAITSAAPTDTPAMSAGLAREPRCVTVPHATPVEPARGSETATANAGPAGSGAARTGKPAATRVARARSALVVADGGPNGAMAAASSATFGNRSAGFFFRQVSIAATTWGGTSVRADAMGMGSSISTFAHSSGIASAMKGTWPARAS